MTLLQMAHGIYVSLLVLTLTALFVIPLWLRSQR